MIKKQQQIYTFTPTEFKSKLGINTTLGIFIIHCSNNEIEIKMKTEIKQNKDWG